MKNNGNLQPVGVAFIIAFIFVAISYFCGCTSEKERTAKLKEMEIIRIPADYESKPKPIVVAVIDTGFDFKSDWKAILKSYPTIKKPRLCKYGHKDFTGAGLIDNHGHGTHVAGLIAQFAKDANYCLVILKYYDPKIIVQDNLEQTRKSFERAIALKVDIINYSGGGKDRSKEECSLIKEALDSGIQVVAAAGNERKNINQVPYYPAACDRRVQVVANVERNGEYANSSNFTDGKLNSMFLYTEMGVNVMSIAPNNQLNFMTGTSQAAAIKTGKDVFLMDKPLAIPTPKKKRTKLVVL